MTKSANWTKNVWKLRMYTYENQAAQRTKLHNDSHESIKFTDLHILMSEKTCFDYKKI